MKRRPSRIFACLSVVALGAMLSANAATLPSDWQHEQSFEVAASGLVKLSIPIETLDAARPGLEDLRVYDDASNEVPYLIEHPAPAPAVVRNAKSFQTSLNSRNSVITIETGFTQAIESITLATPGKDFAKAVMIEGSEDGQSWQEIERGKAIFNVGGVSELELEIPPKTWPWLRLYVDDVRSAPIPFTSVRIRAAAGESAPSEDVPVTIADRHENPGETRLTLNLPAANLNLSEIRIDTSDPLFTRQVNVAVPQIAEDSVREQTIGGGVIYRLMIEGRPASGNVSVPMQGSQVRSRELLLLIQNHDSPPLAITGAHAERRPVYLVFLARQAGVHHLLSGNARCSAPQYDLAAFGANLRTMSVAPMKFSAMVENPAFHPPEVLPEVQENGTALDISAWRFRKPVKISHTGPQQLEPDLDVLSRSQSDFADARLIRDGKQVPYILDRTSISRSITPAVTMTNDAEDPRVSRWILKLPLAGLPVNRLDCKVGAAVFQRDLVLYEETSDERGEKSQRVLGRATWTHKPGSGQNFSIALDSPPQGDTLFLETQNGDNAPIQLSDLTLFYPVTRLLFKARAEDALFLYYGNSEASAPRYDLSLVANELVAANKSAATLGPEEMLKFEATPKGASGTGGMVFWGILALVVVVLLVVISRLLPKSESQPPK